MRGKIVKISRYGEAFWIKNIREVEAGMFIGVVDNELRKENPFRIGDSIPFAACEVGETMDYPTPTLRVVN